MQNKVADPEIFYVNKHQGLIDRCKVGNQRAQFQIYKLYYKAMYNTSLRIVNDPMEAEDIMQESFLSAFEKIGSYSGTVSFGAWLKRIVQNRSLDFLRKNTKYVFEDIELFQDLANDRYETVPPDEEPDNRLNKIKHAIKDLPYKCQEILSLYLFEGYDHEEISEIMSISGSTSRSQYSRARQRLIRELTEK